MPHQKKMMTSKDAIKMMLSHIIPIITLSIISLGILLIKIVTYERGTEGVITEKKARRIRFLTKIKYKWLNKHKSLEKFVNIEQYHNTLKSKLEGTYGM